MSTTTTTTDASTAGRKESGTMSTPTVTVPNPLDGLTADQLAGAVRLLRPANPHQLAPVSVTLPGKFRDMTVLSDASVTPEPGTVGVTVAQLAALHRAGEGWRFGPKGCPFCL